MKFKDEAFQLSYGFQLDWDFVDESWQNRLWVNEVYSWCALQRRNCLFSRGCYWCRVLHEFYLTESSEGILQRLRKFLSRWTVKGDTRPSSWRSTCLFFLGDMERKSQPTRYVIVHWILKPVELQFYCDTVYLRYVLLKAFWITLQAYYMSERRPLFQIYLSLQQPCAKR